MPDPSGPFRKISGGVTVALRVTPGSARNRIEGTMTDVEGGIRLKVTVTAAPEDGKANKAVAALPAREWRLAKSHITVKAGAGARNKIFHFAGDGDELFGRLRTLEFPTNG